MNEMCIRDRYLAEAAEEAGVVDRLQLKASINGAEPWTDEMRKKIEGILHINSFDIYGLCEITGPGVAMDCIHHKGLHVYEDYFYPEILNPADHTACADGETGELVFTTLAKEGMPLIRYRTKDLTSIESVSYTHLFTISLPHPPASFIHQRKYQRRCQKTKLRNGHVDGNGLK